MKLKSLILGSVAAAGLSTAGYAADLGVLTSLDVCDSLGISGLTLSSADNCLQITGGVTYDFIWGDWNREGNVVRLGPEGFISIPVANSIGGADKDWESKVETWLKAVGTASSDFGPASATIKLKAVERLRTWNEGVSNRAGTVINAVPVTEVNGDTTAGFEIDEAYVQVGDTTTLLVGKKGSIADLGDDAPYNFLGLFHSAEIDGRGVGVDGDFGGLGGTSIQVVSDIGNGLKVGVGLENLNGDFDLLDRASATPDADEPGFPANQGTLVGVVSYAGEGITAHVTGAALGVLDGDVESWFVHAGATGSFDAFKVRGAVSYWDDYKYVEDLDVLNALLSVEGTFDLFTVALSGEAVNVNDDVAGLDYTNYGVGGSVGVGITEGVSINLGARYFYDDLNDLDTTQVAVQVVAALTETIKATGEIGGYFGDGVDAGQGALATGADFVDEDTVYYGAAELGWAPGGNFTSSIRGEVYSTDAYKVTFKAAKEFK